MAKTYAQINKEIENLQKEAATLRAAELKVVISRINEAIAVYGITLADLAFDGKTKSVAAPKTKAMKAAATKRAFKQYADGAGNTWTGRGPRPKWLRDISEKGGDISKFVVTGKSAGAPAKSATSGAPVTAATKSVVKAKSPVAAKYRDPATGSSWSGRGSKPTWLRMALESGRKINEFTVAAARAAAEPKKAKAKAKAKTKNPVAAKKSPPSRKPPAANLNGAASAQH